MPTLYDPVKIGALELPNRIVMAPLTRMRAFEERAPGPLNLEHYVQRASAGLILTEATSVTPHGVGYPNTPGLWSELQVQRWTQIVAAVHKAGGRIVTQLWHVGRISDPAYLDGKLPVAPSAIAPSGNVSVLRPQKAYEVPRALETEEIPVIVADFRKAAENAKRAGFDGVELHAANGYLFDQFLHDGSNKRTDRYGGSIENRARFLLEVMREVCEEVGRERVGLRLSPVTTANDIADDDPQPLFDHVVRQLAPLGLAYLHLIEGATGGPREVEGRPFDYAAMLRAWREAGAKGAWMVNNGYDQALAGQALAQGADLVAFGRAYIANPDLVERLRTGAPLNPVEKATLYGGGAEGYTDYPPMGK